MVEEEQKKQETEGKIEEAEKKEIKNENKDEKIVETKKIEERKEEKAKTEVKQEEKKPEKAKVKKTEAIVNTYNFPISTKHSIAICKFIKWKKIQMAINDLEQVIIKKKPLPMKGEIPHRKGIMSGRFPKKASEHFIKLLKTLAANSNNNNLNEPIISEAIANIGYRPYGKFGRVRKKRTRIKIVAKEKAKPLVTSSKLSQSKEKK